MRSIPEPTKVMIPAGATKGKGTAKAKAKGKVNGASAAVGSASTAKSRAGAVGKSALIGSKKGSRSSFASGPSVSSEKDKGKIKSAEVIEDSDEEAAAYDSQAGLGAQKVGNGATGRRTVTAPHPPSRSATADDDAEEEEDGEDDEEEEDEEDEEEDEFAKLLRAEVEDAPAPALATAPASMAPKAGQPAAASTTLPPSSSSSTYTHPGTQPVRPPAEVYAGATGKGFTIEDDSDEEESEYEEEDEE